ncbi:MAG: transcriptional regulator [Nitriliruptor sp.]|nr:MAG: transcriptional regulator [Nitriliruptor sp.]
MRNDIHATLALPTQERGPRLLELPEDQWFDRKSSRIHPRELADALIGLANAEGGVLVVGLHGGVIEGVGASPDRRNAWRQAAVDYTVPPVPTRFSEVECENDRGATDTLVVIEVAPSDRVHSNRRDEVFLRIGDETRRLTFGQRRELEFDKGQSNLETTPVHTIERTALDEDLLREFSVSAGANDTDRLLAARGLLTADGRVTIGATLLFSAAPQVELPEAYVRVLRYRGTARGSGRRQQVTEDIRIEGPLPTQIREAEQHVRALLPTRRALGGGGRFADVGAVPRDAWLEGLVNAVIHRSYSVMGDHIRVEIFDDRLEIESPGRFPGIVDVSRPEEIARFARNPRLARVLADLGFGQELGEGVLRMHEEMRLAGLADPGFHQTAGSVVLTLSYDPVDRELEARLPPAARALARTIREQGRASTGDLVSATGSSRPVVIRNLRVLEDAGVVEWIGTSPKDPRAYWRLKG